MDDPAKTDARFSLCRASGWRFRRRGGEGPWHASASEALAAGGGVHTRLEWFDRWRVWEVPRAVAPFAPADAAPSAVPEAVIELRPSAIGLVDLEQAFGGEVRNGRAAWLVTHVHLPRPAIVTLHVGADYWTDWWVDGRRVFDTYPKGNLPAVLERAYAVQLSLSEGRHEVAVRVLSGNGGWSLAAEATSAPATADAAATLDDGIEAVKAFDVPSPGQICSIAFIGAEPQRVRLNGRPIGAPRPGIVSRRVPGLPPQLLRQGTNELTVDWSPEEAAGARRVAELRYFNASGDHRQLLPDADILAYRWADVALEWGPVAGVATESSFTLTCRTNQPCEVVLNVAGKDVALSTGMAHRLVADGLPPGTRHDYELWARDAGAAPVRLAAAAVRTLPADGELILAVTADAGPLPEVWREVSARIRAVAPHLCVFVGDMVSYGRREELWADEFLEPAAPLLASVPLYPILGNHDEDSPLFEEIFAPPGGRNWSQRVGPAMLVGLDGAAAVSAPEPLLRWLEQTLTYAADAPFILVFNHYPAWSSGPHLRNAPDGLPAEPPCRAAREVLLPVLQRHNVSAVFSGHDHLYERSVLPSGVTLFGVGGAGAFLYERGARADQNPHSAAYTSAHHCCLLRIGPTACHVEAISRHGQILDRTTLPPRSRR